MKIPVTLLFLAAAALGCKSSDSSHGAKSADFPCNCGTPEAAFEPCLHQMCAHGKNNPDNPDCVCGTMKIEEGPK